MLVAQQVKEQLFVSGFTLAFAQKAHTRRVDNRQITRNTGRGVRHHIDQFHESLVEYVHVFSDQLVLHSSSFQTKYCRARRIRSSKLLGVSGGRASSAACASAML